MAHCSRLPLITINRLPTLRGLEQFTVIISVDGDSETASLRGSARDLSDLHLLLTQHRTSKTITVFLFSSYPHCLETQKLTGSLGTSIIWFPEEVISIF